MPGVSGLVPFGGEPALVLEGLVHAIQKRIDEINNAGGELFNALKPGGQVIIQSVPFSGYEAIFDIRQPGSERVRVKLKLL